MNRLEPGAETEAIWLEFHARLRAFISRRVGRQADADDILQEVFVRIQRGVASLKSRERLSAWIFQITRNTIVDHYRASTRQAAAPPEDFDPPSPDGRDTRTELLELSSCIEPMLATMSRENREALELTELAGLTQVEAARRSGISLTGMKSRVQRARRQLKEKLLSCCRIDLDRRGGLVDYAVRDERESPCGSCNRED